MCIQLIGWIHILQLNSWYLIFTQKPQRERMPFCGSVLIQSPKVNRQVDWQDSCSPGGNLAGHLVRFYVSSCGKGGNWELSELFMETLWYTQNQAATWVACGSVRGNPLVTWGCASIRIMVVCVCMLSLYLDKALVPFHEQWNKHVIFSLDCPLEGLSTADTASKLGVNYGK